MLPERILLPTDGSGDAVRATEAASDLAKRRGAELHVVHVWHDVRGFAHDFVKRELKEVRPSLVAVGSRGLTGIMRTRLGSVSTKVVTAARGPVLVYPHVG